MFRLLQSCTSCSGKAFVRSAKAKPVRMSSAKVVKSDDEWRKQLTDQEYRVLRKGDTDRPHSGEYDTVLPKTGYFQCRGCGAPLYSAASKFKCGCGWPAFDKAYKGFVAVKEDVSHGMRRTEVLCQACDGHLGHVFMGEGLTNTNQRHCVNSSSITYVDKPLPKPIEESTI
ncbi:Peptide methionine sulfoxide reductase B5 [Diplonema papillatum]|nr:Peptide methionine sulfoxide reductase B5 [Diplonema papillatum]